MLPVNGAGGRVHTGGDTEVGHHIQFVTDEQGRRGQRRSPAEGPGGVRTGDVTLTVGPHRDQRRHLEPGGDVDHAVPIYRRRHVGEGGEEPSEEEGEEGTLSAWLRSDRGIVVRLRYQKGDVKREETTGKERVVVFEPDSVVGLYEGLARWELRKKALGMLDGEVRSYWALPGETRTLHWKQSKMNDMLALFLGARGVVAPKGFAYTYHSLRHMAASSMKAIGLSDRHIMAAGRWKALESIETYIDPYCKATGGCYRFFGYLLPPVDRLASLARKPSDMRQW